jgi:superfamily I DNA/RNA helicase
VVSDPKAAAFVKNFYTQIERLTLEGLAKMDNGEIEITHDFYLKKFQLSEPTLSYDYILFDEGQDASAAMLEVFLKQKGKKIIVGDMHQQIYGWRYAINSLQQVDFPIFNLSNSFRFDEEVALVANKILSWKKYLQKPPSVRLTGVGNLSENNLTKAILGRTNLTLLLNAISRWQQGDLSKLYFEGNINSYTFADEGASLYDVLNLYNGKFGNIRDKLIAGMKSIRELEEYIDKTEDNSLAIIVEVVKQFGNRLPSLINELKTHHTATKEEAEMIFSTVHRCKGMEYDEVTLLNDFINEEKLKRQIEQNGGDKMNEANRNRLAEEVNVLYVAATRAKNKLCIPPEINPLKSIQISQTPQGAIPAERKSYIPDFKWEEKTYRSSYLNEHRSSRGSSNEMKGITYGKRWTPEEKEEVMELFQQKLTVKKIAEKMRRTPLSIKFKLMDLGVSEEEIF